MRLAAAGLSSRLMAESIARAGDSVIALDVFGDVDTRRVSSAWHGIGRANALEVDDDALLAALHGIAERDEAEGWVAGSGFEARPDLLERGAALLPLLGMRPDAQRRLRDPASFFGTLAKLAVAHPETRLEAPDDPRGWLAKEGGGSGGWQVTAAVDAPPAASGRYWQRLTNGEPMSATFVANGRGVRVLGFNRLLTRRSGPHPFVFRGAIGPVAVEAAVARTLRAWLDRLVPAFDLRGLCSLDFLLDGSKPLVLEINARPPASMGLYSARLMRAHVRSSRGGRLPAARASSCVRGFEILFARGAWRLDEERAAALDLRADCHDRPRIGTSFGPGEPVCSVSAHGPSADRVAERLARAVESLTRRLEPAT